jgi:hypothetical protein
LADWPVEQFKEVQDHIFQAREMLRVMEADVNRMMVEILSTLPYLYRAMEEQIQIHVLARGADLQVLWLVHRCTLARAHRTVGAIAGV